MSFTPAPSAVSVDAYPTLVIGAGPAGLAFANRCPESCLVLEQDEAPGGLCRSREIDGTVCDLGGHVFHTSSPQVQAFVAGCVPLYGQQRQARFAFGRQILPYPLSGGFQAIFDVMARKVQVRYPIPLRGLAPARERILAALREMDIHSIGRFGAWAYSNCDTCLEAGWELARQWPGIT